ncbi:MAG: cyclic nucleotide-binding domain-containing protein, partial [Duncaniella sp.]|nr:cyclic nucleotide-binding domain-containing protein [Duncaniella sp.]
MIRSTLEQVITEDMAELWQLLSSEEKHLVMDNFVIHDYKKNQIIYAEKDEPEFLWCLLEGKVKKYKDGVGGRMQILRLIKPVQYFGYRAYFAHEPYVSTAATLEPSRIGSIPMTIVEQLISKNNNLAMFFIHELSRNLGSSDT